LGKQLFPQAKVLFITGGILLFFAIVPGMPKLSFIFLSLLCFGIGYLMHRKQGAPSEEEAEGDEAAQDGDKSSSPEEEEVKDLLEMDTMELEIGFGIIPLVDAAQGGTLLNRIKSIRRQIALEMGFIVPPVRIRDNLRLDADEYSVLIKGVRTAKGSVMPDRYMAMNPAGGLDDINGIATKEPAFGLPAKWVDEIEKEKAELSGYTIVDPATIIATHLTEIIKRSAFELVGRQETQELLDKLKEKHPKLVEDLVPGVLDLSVINRVLQNLLRERVSIRNLQTILEALSAYGTMNKDIEYLSEKARYALRRQITESLLASDGKLYVFALPQQIEQLVIKSLHPSDEGREVVLDPAVARKVLTALMDKNDEITAKGIPPVLFVSQPIRFAVKRFVEKYAPTLNIIAHTEVSDSVQIESLGTLEVS
ncbi:MAG: FHIPEP family type III secretion protein, partial [Deferribacterales bacterium]|nr:FHIPEP family type III secretion protein [Deferribacterales bacterium]